MTEPSDTLAAAVEAVFPDGTVEELAAQTTRPGNETARVVVDGEPYYLKTATDATTRLVRETAATRYAGAHCDLGVPTVHAAAPDGDPPVLVTEPLGGTPLNDHWTGAATDPTLDRAALLRRTGRALAGVHAATLDRPGVVTGGDADGLALEGGDWTETLCATVRFRATDWFAERFADLPDRLTEVLRAVEPTAPETTLLHGDPSRINLHVEPLGLLDWERALGGDPAFDLVEAESHHLGQPDVDDEAEARLRAALHEGYRERRGALPAGYETHRPVYWAVARLLVPQTFEDWAPEAEEPTEELATWVRETYEETLTAAREAA